MSVIDSLSLGGTTYSLRDNDGRAIIAGTESSTTSAHAYSAGNYFILNDTLYKATASIAVGGTITVGTNCQATTVCGEVGELKSEIIQLRSDVDSDFDVIVSNTSETAIVHTSADGFTSMDGYVIGSDGQPSSSSNYITFYKEFTDDADIWFEAEDKTHYSAFLAISTKTGTTYTSRKRYISGSEDTLPGSSSKLAISSGTTLYISCYKSAYTTYGYPTFYKEYTASGYELNPSLPLADEHIDQVKTALHNKPCKVIYEEATTVESSEEQLTIYTPAKIGYIKHQFVHSVDNTKNANVWRCGIAYAVDESLQSPTQLTTSGEWECAVKLSGRSDYSGGIAHGDEVMDNVVCFVDGKVTTISAITSLTGFEELKIIEYSTLYDPNDSETIIAIHGSEHIYNRDGLTINQSLIWAKAVTAINAYMAMFPVSKSVTDTFFCNGGVKDNDTNIRYPYKPVSIVASTQYTGTFANKATIYSTSAGFIAGFDVPEYPSGYSNGDYFLMLDNGSNQYNKCYYCILNSSGSVTYEIAKDTVWKSTTVFRMDKVS